MSGDPQIPPGINPFDNPFLFKIQPPPSIDQRSALERQNASILDFQRQAEESIKLARSERTTAQPFSLDDQLRNYQAQKLLEQRAADKALEETRRRFFNESPPSSVDNRPPTPKTSGAIPRTASDPKTIRTAEPVRPFIKPASGPPTIGSAGDISGFVAFDSPATKGLAAPPPPGSPPISFAEPPPSPPPTIGGQPGTRPGGLPGSIGVGGSAAIGGAVLIGVGLAQGQPVGSVVGSVAASTLGAVGGAYIGGAIGGVIGSAVPVLGTIIGAEVGAALGGAIGGIIGGTAYQSAFPSPASPPPAPQLQGPTPFTGGQNSTLYTITWKVDGIDGYGVPRIGIQSGFSSAKPGPISAITINQTDDGLVSMEHAYSLGDPTRRVTTNEGSGLGAGGHAHKIYDIKVRRLDGYSDIEAGNPSPLPIPFAPSPPGGVSYHPQNSRQDQYWPNPSPIPDGGNQRGDRQNWIPHGSPAPGRNPNPDHAGGNLGGGLPVPQPQPTPNPYPPPQPQLQLQTSGGSPSPQPQPKPQPGAGEQTLGGGGTTGGGSNLIGGGIVAAGIAIGLSGVALSERPGSYPDAFKATRPDTPPPAPNYNNPGTGCEIDPCMAGLQRKSQSIDDRTNRVESKLDDLLAKLGTAGSVGSAAEGALMLQRLAAFEAKFDQFFSLWNAFSTKFNQFAEWIKLDRILNILTLITTFHNAYMLSNALTQTLFSMVSNVLAAVGFKDYTSGPEGTPFDVNKIVSDFVDHTAKAALGTQTVDGIKTEWKKYSRIYQAAANVLFSIQSISQSILSALEIVGGWQAQVGNALQRWRVVGEKAFGWMNPQVNFQNRFFTGLERATDVVSQIDSIASETLSAEESFTQLGKNIEDVKKSVAEADNSKQGTKPPEAQKLAVQEQQSAVASKAPDIPVSAQVKPEV